MKFGANLWIWESPVTIESLECIGPRLVEWGFDLVELPLETADAWSPTAVAARLESLGLAASVCVAMSPDRDLTTDDPATVQRTRDYLRAAIDAAARLGASCIAGPIYSPTGYAELFHDAERARTLDRLAENLRPVLDHADNAGVGIAIEPLNRFETSLFNTTGQLMAFIEQVNHPRLGVLLDTFHMNIEERDIPAAIRDAGTHLLHFHACGNDRGAPRNGAISWPAIADALREIDYDGALVVESFTAENDTIAKAASIWRPLAESQDAIAIEGVATLRAAFAESVTPPRGSG